MKLKKLGFFLALTISGAIVANAQGGGSRRTVEERVQMVHAKMDSAFKLETEKKSESGFCVCQLLSAAG